MKLFLASAIATILLGSVAPDSADARGRGGRSYRSARSLFAKPARRASYPRSYYGSRGTSDSGECPCNGGNVCVGPRGGRYCITSGGKKRYGV